MKENLKSNKNNFDYILSTKDKEITKLSQKIIQLENKIISLEKELIDSKITFQPKTNNHVEKEKSPERSNQDNNIKKIESMEQEMKNQKKSYEDAINSLKLYIETMNYKIEFAKSIERANGIQSKYIDEIEAELNEIKKKNKEDQNSKTITTDIRNQEHRQKMMTELLKAKQNMIKIEESKREVTVKLTLLQHNEIINELERQSKMIDELVKNKESLETVIKQLKSDITIHEKIEKVMAEKNRKLHLVLSENSSRNLQSKHPLKNLSENEFAETKASFYSNLNTRNSIQLVENKNNQLRGKSNDFVIFRKFEFKYKNLKEQYNQKKIENENLKTSNEMLKSKVESYEKKSEFIFNIVEEAYHNLNSKDSMKKDIIRNNYDDFVKTNINSLDNSSKHSVLDEIIKKLSPLLMDVQRENKSNLKHFIDEKILKKNRVFSFSKTRNSFLSFNSMTTDQKSFTKRNISFKFDKNDK